MSEQTTPAQAPAPTTEATPTPEAQPTSGTAPPIHGDRVKMDAFARAMAALDKQDKEPEPAAAAPAEEPAASDTEAQPEATPEPVKEQPGALESDRLVRALEEQRAAVRALEQQRSEYEAKLREIDSEKAGLSKLAQARKALDEGDALTALAELGVTYEDLTRAVIGGAAPKVAVKSPMEQQLEALAAKHAALEQQLTKREADAQRNAAVGHVRSEVPQTDFPLLAAVPAWEEEVIEGVRLEWERAGYAGDVPPVSPRDIAERLEAYLAEETLKRAKLSPKVLAALAATNDPSHVKPPAAPASAAPAKPNVSARTLLPTDSGTVSRVANGADEATLKARALAVLGQ